MSAAVERAKEALKGDDVTLFNEAGDELSQAFSAAGKEIYEAHAAEAGDAEASEEADAEAESEADVGDGTEAAADDDVVEADYEIVDEEK